MHKVLRRQTDRDPGGYSLSFGPEQSIVLGGKDAKVDSVIEPADTEIKVTRKPDMTRCDANPVKT